MNEKYMKHAVELALKGSGYVSPNPLVGAVLVKDDKVIGEGYHGEYGGAHAEVNAINNSTVGVEGSTLYVTLEPCSHYGKTPPCSLLIAEKKIKKVVIGSKDPNTLVAGKGIKYLKEQGVEVVVGILEDECRDINKYFFKHIVTKIPYVILKSAMTLDGKIATRTGKSKWISGELSRQYVHSLRHEVDAIMVGVNTVIMDNPSLTTRLQDKKGVNPIRIIVDTNGIVPLQSKVFNDDGTKVILGTTDEIDEKKVDLLEGMNVEVIIVDKKDGEVDLNKLMCVLGEMGINSILLEGGGTLNYSALHAGIVDEVNMFIAPKIFGGRDAITPVEGQGIDDISDNFELEEIEYKLIGNDLLVTGKLKKGVR